MKTQIVILFALFALLAPSISIDAQDAEPITSEFMVKGVCDQCKARIENAAYIKGVKFCEWNKETKVFKVIYDPQKTDLKKIHESIAAAGHTTDMVTADPEAYNKLPKCCRYDDGVHAH
jgi:hypothetical protein